MGYLCEIKEVRGPDERWKNGKGKGFEGAVSGETQQKYCKGRLDHAHRARENCAVECGGRGKSGDEVLFMDIVSTLVERPIVSTKELFLIILDQRVSRISSFATKRCRWVLVILSYRQYVGFYSWTLPCSFKNTTGAPFYQRKSDYGAYSVVPMQHSFSHVSGTCGNVRPLSCSTHFKVMKYKAMISRGNTVSAIPSNASIRFL